MEKHQEEKVINAFDRIKSTFILREGVLISFLVAIALFEITGIYDFYKNNHWLLGLISLWLLTAFVFRYLVQKQKTAKAISDVYLYYHTLVELPILSVIVYFIGGAEWLGSLFFFFPIVFTSIFFSKKRALLITTVASIYYAILILLPFFDLVPFQQYYPLGRELHKDPTFVSLNLMYPILAFYLISIAANIPTGLLKEKTAELSKTKSALEEERKTLEDKVAKRTKELSTEKLNLENKVQERTKDLQERVRELEQFHELTTGRELKMVELKNEIEEKNKKIEELEKEMAGPSD